MTGITTEGELSPTHVICYSGR